MKVLVTGGTGGFGMTVCRQLARAGADPVAMARNEPAVLPPGVRFVAGDIRDPDAIARALTGCDAVVHLAWYMGVGNTDEVDQINIGGTTNLLDAMERSGVRRLVFTSSTTTYGPADDHPAPFHEDEPLRPMPTFPYPVQKERVERAIAARDLDAVVARVTVLLGREVDNEPAQVYALPALMDIGGQSVVQAVHQDDVGRFIERAALGSWKGTVNLAAPGSVSMARAGELLERRVLRVPLGVSMRAGKAMHRMGVDGFDDDVARLLAYWPVADTTRLTEEWGFHPVWSQEDILRDQARSASRKTYLAPGSKVVPRRRRLPWASTTPPDPRRLRPGADVRHAAPEGVRGSLDTQIDAAYPVYSATNLSEAFPGPMTPLSLDLAVDGMSSAVDGLVQIFGMEGEVANLMRLGLGTFGHSVYVNVSTARLMADFVPGATVEQVDRMYLGIESEPAPKQRMTPKEALTAARLGGRIAPRVAGMRSEVDRLAADVAVVAARDVVSLTDDELVSHLMLVHDLVCQAWNTSSTGNFLLSGLTSALDGDDHGEGSAGAATLRGVRKLAAQVRADASLQELLAGDLAGVIPRMRSERPSFATSFNALIADCGHRGPGETELENDTFADRPELLLDVIRRTAARPAEATSPVGGTGRRSPVARLARRVLEDKERARDSGVRAIHAFRVAVRERARRLVEDGKLADAGDVFYCTYEELLSVSQPPAEVLDDRRGERARLATYRMPLSFEGTWTPEVDDAAGLAGPGTVLTGVAAVDGVHEGIARVMTSPTDDLEPDDVLVTSTTDIGWTPYFALAGAVVTDIGGVASHAAIVAREHGIPSVVGMGDATRRLRSGMRVRVDGAAGTVEVLEV
ncbi:MAG: NAD-dependent epimerase/dehydratase family protein [Actinomycetota bacterium]|nr:NAD-dependent epimerase/dehydratase family protein [Actinomycetota bacterium]